MTFCTSIAEAVMVAFFVQGGLAHLYVNPEDLHLSPGSTAPVEILCIPPGFIDPSSILLVRISRKTTSRPEVDQAIATAFAQKKIKPGQAVVVSPGSGGLPLNTATVWGSIRQRFVELTLTQAGPADAGVYYCNVSYIGGEPSFPEFRSVTSHQKLTVTVV